MYQASVLSKLLGVDPVACVNMTTRSRVTKLLAVAMTGNMMAAVSSAEGVPSGCRER